MKTTTHLIPLRGGLGNQLFGLAYGLNLEKRGENVFYSFVNQYERNPELHPFLSTKKLINVGERGWRYLLRLGTSTPLLRRHFIIENSIDNHEFLQSKFFIHWGYWQDRNYADQVANEMQLILNVSPEMKPNENLNEAVVHVRRGDYVTNSRAAAKHGVLDSEYFICGTEMLRERGYSSFRIISDDAVWVSDYLVPRINGSYVSLKNQSTIGDFQLIISAEAVVLSNSTFSWWGAFLGGTLRPTVAPGNWFSDGSPAPNLYYPEWRVIY